MYNLIDCQERNRKYWTFEVPSQDAIDRLRPGDFAKLVFDDRERMWVEISKRDCNYFDGQLANHPIDLDEIEYGDRVCFHAKHIADIRYVDRSEEPLPDWCL